MNAMTSGKTVQPLSAFSPKAPEDLQSLDISESLVEELMLRRLYTIGICRNYSSHL